MYAFLCSKSNISLISAAVFFLLCWKSIRVLFMKMVDWEVARADFGGSGGVTGEKRRQTEGGGGGDFKGSSTRVSLNNFNLMLGDVNVLLLREGTSKIWAKLFHSSTKTTPRPTTTQHELFQVSVTEAAELTS